MYTLMHKRGKEGRNVRVYAPDLNPAYVVNAKDPHAPLLHGWHALKYVI
jgi:hypothetical protein